MARRSLLVLATVFACFSFAGCAGDEQAQDEQSPPATPEGETDGRAITDGNGEVTVGGFAVEGPGGEETIPRVSADREAAREYVEQVRPIVEDTARDVSGLARPEVRVENGRLALDVDAESLRGARDEVQGGLERLRAVEPPEGLEPVNERLISTSEGGLSAYDDLVAAAESGNPEELRAAVRESLPRIERFNEEARAVTQELQRAVGT